MVHFQQDYLEGTKKQEIIYPILKGKFGEELKASTDRWAKYDFYTDKSFFELKSRTNKKNKYPTTLMTCNKVIDTEKEIYFLFNFVDELSYIKFDTKLFSTFERKPYSRINAEFDKKDYYFIPIEHLQTIQTY
jgi:hypothetical protein